MASAAILQQAGRPVAPTPDISSPERANTQSPNIDSQPERNLPEPFDHVERRLITSETKRLILKRRRLEQILLRKANAEQSQTGSKPRRERLSHKDALRLNKVLASREARHIRVRNKLIEERERLLKCDPSVKRKIDLALLQALLSKFKRSLGDYLPDREQRRRPREAHSRTSSRGSHGNDDKDSQNEELLEPDDGFSASSALADFDNDNDRDSPHTDSSAGAEQHPASGLDGSFDDYSIDSKRRRLAGGPSNHKTEEERQTEAKKEQTANNQDQATPLKGRSPQHKVANSDLENEEAEFAADSSAINSMSQSKKEKRKVHGQKASTQTDEPDTNGTAPNSKSSPPHLASVKTNGAETKATKPQPKTQRSRVQKAETPKEPLFEPWYTRHARAMMDPDFDDLVYDRPSRKRKRTRSDEVVCGAMPDPRDAVKGGAPLPTPPTSSPAPSSSSSAPSEPKKKIGKSQGRSNLRKGKNQRGKARNSNSNSNSNHRSSVPEPSASDSSGLSGSYNTVSSTQTAASSIHKGPSNAIMSAS